MSSPRGLSTYLENLFAHIALLRRLVSENHMEEGRNNFFEEICCWQEYKCIYVNVSMHTIHLF